MLPTPDLVRDFGVTSFFRWKSPLGITGRKRLIRSHSSAHFASN